MKRREIYLTIGCATSLVLSVIAIFVSVYRTDDLGFDYQGVLVGILALLVTALIGWNIYNLIDIDKIRKEMNERKGDVMRVADYSSKNSSKIMATSEYANWMIYHYLLLKTDPLGLEYRLLHSGIMCLYHTSKYGDMETCNSVIKGLLENIGHPEEITLPVRDRNILIDVLSSTENKEKIQGFTELVGRVSRIKLRS